MSQQRTFLPRLGMGLVFALTLVAGVISTQATPITASVMPASVPPSTPGNAPVITTNSLPSGAWKTAYTATINGFDSDLGQSITASASGLPNGLSIGNCNSFDFQGKTRFSCTIQGTPAAVGTFSVTITVKDNTGRQSSTTLPLQVARFIYTEK